MFCAVLMTDVDFTESCVSVRGVPVVNVRSEAKFSLAMSSQRVSKTR